MTMYSHFISLSDLLCSVPNKPYKHFIKFTYLILHVFSQVIAHRNLGTVEGLAVDWIAKNIYWTDAQKVCMVYVRDWLKYYHLIPGRCHNSFVCWLFKH